MKNQITLNLKNDTKLNDFMDPKFRVLECSKCEDQHVLIHHNQTIMEGDYYHDKIKEKILGFKECLKYLGVIHKFIQEDYICEHCKLEKSYEN